MNKIQVPPPPHVHFDRRGRAYVEDDNLASAVVAVDNFGTEHQRLKDAVVDKARQHRRYRQECAAYTFEDREFDDAVDALNEYEATNAQTQSQQPR